MMTYELARSMLFHISIQVSKKLSFDQEPVLGHVWVTMSNWPVIIYQCNYISPPKGADSTPSTWRCDV